GEFDERSQKRLDEAEKANKIILACQLVPTSDMRLITSLKPTFNADLGFEFTEEDPKDMPPPDPELWVALKNGDLLTEILTDFYDKVYVDELLSPFFHRVTKDWVIQKQFNFMNEMITGNLVYMGYYPRNSHHWMVITNELFDHREKLFDDSMKKCGLDVASRAKIRKMNDFFRSRMVKEHPWPKILDGHIYPLEGYETHIAEIEMVCDKCFREIQIGEPMRYNTRLETIYCKECSANI
ncbi:MAG: hypothetical protein OEY56_10265, partial [Cyclobacteriaceae bacterium]|nr:hypothetical protein [Cyclobacteriaceae bacterium]